ncbi:MAG: GerAB/ArcD/ProY family transporter, partial [Oscillospiraceae bacterium]|nr:GerAB/ArcD/ProY family transporter [Oscillospiraceae bacterium]
AALLLLAAWLLLYGGFVLRAGAERFVVTAFPHADPAVFSVTLGLLALLGALGPARTLARIGRIVLPLQMAVLLAVLGFGLLSVDRTNLLPLTVFDAGAVLRGMPPVLDVLAFGLYGGCFLLGGVPREPGAERALSAWLVRIALLLTLLSAAVIGSFGAELCARLTQPFFTLVRNLVFFRSLERAEALVVTFWVFPDFLLSALLLYGAQHCLRLALGADPAYRGEARRDLRGGRWSIPLCGAALFALELVLAPDAECLRFWSERMMPECNLGVAFGLIPFLYIIGKQKKTL